MERCPENPEYEKQIAEWYEEIIAKLTNDS